MAEKAVSAIQRWPYNSLSNRVVCVIVMREQPVAQQRPDACRPENVPQRLVVIALVAGDILDFPGIMKGDSTASSGSAQCRIRTRRVGGADGQ
jgi:hypothetical protein